MCWNRSEGIVGAQRKTEGLQCEDNTDKNKNKATVACPS